jgi:hypothetical protein
MSMNPDRLGEEFDEIRKAALATLDYSDPNGVVDALKTQMDAWWHGEAAQTFSTQLNRNPEVYRQAVRLHPARRARGQHDVRTQHPVPGELP